MERVVGKWEQQQGKGLGCYSNNGQNNNRFGNSINTGASHVYKYGMNP